jgi:hypothetical protein
MGDRGPLAGSELNLSPVSDRLERPRLGSPILNDSPGYFQVRFTSLGLRFGVPKLKFKRTRWDRRKLTTSS